MSDDVVRLSVIGQIVRRRWRLLLALAVLGAVVGAAASLLWPPSYESSSRVLVQGEPDKSRVLSEAQIAMSLLVLDRAAAGLNWGVAGPALRDSVTAAVADGNVIEIKVTADSPKRARQLADAVTQQYIVFSTEILTKSASASGEVLLPRKDSLLKQIADMNRRISELQGPAGALYAANAQGAAARADLQQLSSNRTDAVKELNDLEGRIAKAQALAAASRENFSVIEPPVAPPAPVAPIRLELIAGGAALATALGVFVLLAIRQADRRLRHSSDIAAALGAPVLGTVEAPIESATNGSSNGHDAGNQRRPSVLRNGAPWDAAGITQSVDQSGEHLRYRRVLARLRGAPDESVRPLVVVVDDDVLASLAARRLATEAADDDALVLSVVAVSAARPTIPDSHDVSGVLVVVTSGTRTAWELLAVAEACHDAGYPVAGVLMVLPRVDGDADPEQLRLIAAVGPARRRVGRGPA
jgi:capsular polysaccharide biosynthesis protein